MKGFARSSNCVDKCEANRNRKPTSRRKIAIRVGRNCVKCNSVDQAEGGDAPRQGKRQRSQGLAQRRGAGGAENRPVRGSLRIAIQHGDDLPPGVGDDAFRPGLSGQDAGTGGGVGRLGRRGMLRRRLIQARQHSDVSHSDSDSALISALQDRVRQLTEEVERLRASHAALDSSQKQMSPVAPKKTTRRAPKKA